MAANASPSHSWIIAPVKGTCSSAQTEISSVISSQKATFRRDRAGLVELAGNQRRRRQKSKSSIFGADLALIYARIGRPWSSTVRYAVGK